MKEDQKGNGERKDTAGHQGDVRFLVEQGKKNRRSGHRLKGCHLRAVEQLFENR